MANQIPVCVYIDGFNLYHSQLEGHPVRWLNLQMLAEEFIEPGEELVTVEYFTAKANYVPWSPDRITRQKAYWDALDLLCPKLVKVFGDFRVDQKTFYDWEDFNYQTGLRAGLARKPNAHDVAKTEEKGSDVKLASHLVRDAYLDRFEKAIVITNDSDQVEPVSIVHSLGKKVILVCPKTKDHKLPREFTGRCAFMLKLHNAVLNRCQMPDPVSVNGRVIHKPVGY
ncbi:MAG: NYN domain-containing protein [Fimbriimonadaceae bacterium]|nr:NYN domain-containing protein [Fimbriimonadaceae bacterium]